MFNARQVQILLLLWNQDHSGDYLAKQVDSSRRTIIRDINTLNQELSKDDTAFINSEGKYSLEIHNYPKFQSLITQFENQDRNILYSLLTHDNLSLDELMDETLLSKLDITNSIERINQRSKNIMNITTKPGLGYLLNLTFGTRVDLLAYLIMIIPKNIGYRINRDDFPSSLRSYITDGQLTAQLEALHLMSAVDLNRFYDNKKQLVEAIQFVQIQSCIEKVSRDFSIQLSKQSLSEKVTLHLRRFNLFPTFISSLLLKQLNDLKLKEPFAFEMAENLKQEIEKANPTILVNSEFLALYIIDCMETKTTVRPVRVLMFTSQRSIAYINENVILESIKNIDLTSIFNRSEFNQKIEENSYDIVITNGFNGEFEDDPTLIINGLIDEATTSRLKKLVSDNYFHNNLDQIFPKQNYLSFPNQSNNYLKTFKEILKYFDKNELLDQKMATKLIDREEEGNQLVINHVAIPHAVNEANFSKIFAVDLDKPVKLNGTEIYFILIVIVNDHNDDYKQLFNYLYKILNHRDITSVSENKTYEHVLGFLKKI